jgi:hypothetical protein
MASKPDYSFSLTTPLGCSARSVNFTSRKAYVRAGSGAAPSSAVFASPAGLEATYHKALMTTIDVGSLTAQTVGNPAAQITTKITGANGNPTMAMNRIRGRYLRTSKDRYRVSSP